MELLNALIAGTETTCRANDRSVKLKGNYYPNKVRIGVSKCFFLSIHLNGIPGCCSLFTHTSLLKSSNKVSKLYEICEFQLFWNLNI